MDVLSDVLNVLGVAGKAGARIGASGMWAVTSSDAHGTALYAVTAGSACLTVKGEAPLMLSAGDAVLVSSPVAHTLSSGPGVLSATCRSNSAHDAQRDGGLLTFGDGEVRTRILAASYGGDPAVPKTMFGLLPTVVHVAASTADPDVADTIGLLGRELARPGVATGVLLDRLVDVILVQLLRVWLASDPAGGVPWWGVLRDPIVHRAVARMHEEPARAWTAELLAQEVAVSRSTLTRRFLSAAGEPPGAYLTRWRMTLASKRLRDTGDGLDVVAASVGYSSAYAFSRAFHREHHMPPARYRRLASTSAAMSREAGHSSAP